jgi:hypothetical protein
MLMRMSVLFEYEPEHRYFLSDHRSVSASHRCEGSAYGDVSLVYELTIGFRIVWHNSKVDVAMK